MHFSVSTRFWAAYFVLVCCDGQHIDLTGRTASNLVGLDDPCVAPFARVLRRLEVEIAELRKQLEHRDSEVAALRAELRRAAEGRMEPMRVSLGDVAPPIPRVPEFSELHEALFGSVWDPAASFWLKWPNFYKKAPDFSFGHSPFWPEGRVTQFLAQVSQLLGVAAWAPRFLVEVGTFFGMSAIRWAQELDRLGLPDVPILCVDPFTGDLNTWLNKKKAVWSQLDVRHSQPLVSEQFMANVASVVNSGEVSPRHILPFRVTAITAARWLQFKGFEPDAVFLDSAHEVDETYMELALFHRLLPEGGVLFGDDYQWPSVKLDVDRFVSYHGLRLRTDAEKRLWVITKT